MYAIIKTGGKQYTVKPGDVFRVEKLDAELGAELNMDVLMVGGDKTFVGDGMTKAAVKVVVTNQERGPKLVIFKKRRRQGYRRTGGHRQPYTELFVSSITSPEGQTVNADKKPNVFSAEKKAAKLAKGAEVREQHRLNARASAKGSSSASASVEAATAPAKKARKAAAPKKSAATKKTTTTAAAKPKKKATKKVAKK